MLLHFVRAVQDERNLVQRSVGAEQVAELQAGHAGHHDVHDDEIRSSLLNESQSLCAALRTHEVESFGPKQCLQELQRVWLILYREDEWPRLAL
jgi:hypothetical protein